ncbi:hypothetical protein D9757_001396 [Collybiopsis confluens]|uniref:NAD-dependent epimerase/dehydratase domain-containing protein n=1 Tax=Collybiopsis confluens TaxID=2823264 RepID=A0A8H5HZ22_9AGAR|nr:hypothetical protein D9757_001396 [Collybiopsis confluens]
MKLTVTGSNGEVGKRVVKLALKRGHTVLGVDLADLPSTAELTPQESGNFTYLGVDLTDYEGSLNAIRGSEGIVHLAGC